MANKPGDTTSPSVLHGKNNSKSCTESVGSPGSPRVRNQQCLQMRSGTQWKLHCLESRRNAGIQQGYEFVFDFDILAPEGMAGREERLHQGNGATQ